MWLMCMLLYKNNPQLVEFLHARVNLYLSDAATQPLLKNGWIDWHLKSKAMAIIDIAVGVYEATLAGGL